MSEKLTDYTVIKRDYGIEPEQIIEVMALSGDSADNIPGIPGVGEKTALSLIQQFHSIENLFQNTNKVTKASLKKKLEEFKEQAFVCKKLVTIKNSVPVDVTLDDLRIASPKKEKLLEIFRELEFKSLIRKFDCGVISRLNSWGINQSLLDRSTIFIQEPMKVSKVKANKIIFVLQFYYPIP